jgi:hypothetical protein
MLIVYIHIFLQGGGEVADFAYHVFDPKTSFEIEGLDFTPLIGKMKDIYI